MTNQTNDDDGRRLVVIAPNWLGDAVMALPALADVRRHFPDAHLAVAARASVAPLFTMVDGVDEVVHAAGRAAGLARGDRLDGRRRGAGGRIVRRGGAVSEFVCARR